MKKIVMTFILLVLTVSLFFMGITREEKLNIRGNVKTEEKVVAQVDTYEKKDREYEKDIVAYLSIPNTEFDVVVAQTNNNYYYLNHNTDGKKDKKGTPFLDYRDSFEKGRILRIYGHNSATIYTEFNFLENYYGEEFYKKNRYIYVETKDETRKYEIFSLYTEYKDWSYYNIDFNDDVAYQSELIKYKNKSDYETGVSVNSKDEILILQTCSYKKEYQKYKNKYYLVMAKRVA